MARKPKTSDAALWRWRVLLLLCAVAAAKLLWNALGLIPVHFDEAQYWAYGQALDVGYYSKPPLVAWVIRAATEVLGDTLSGLRAVAPLAHLIIGWCVFLTGARLFSPRTGFVAALVYLAAPGVTASSFLMTTDPVMMAGWALAMAALAHVITAKAPVGWLWALAGVGVGLGMMAKYTAVAFPLGLTGLALVHGWRPGWRGPLIALVAGLICLAPNIWWNAVNAFATVAHLGENAELQGARLRPGKLAEFIGAQIGVFGPVALLALVASGPGSAKGAAMRPAARGAGRDLRRPFLFWLTAPLILIMCVQALLAGANPNWAAPAYVAGAVLAADWLLGRDWARAIRLHVWIGGLGALALMLGALAYHAAPLSLPRVADPFKKMRIGGPFCEYALTAMEAEGADILLSNDRRRLSECMFIGGFGIDQIRIWKASGAATNHYEMAARLGPGETQPMILIAEGRASAERMAARFEVAEELVSDVFPTHADRETAVSVWRVSGFRGYGS